MSNLSPSLNPRTFRRQVPPLSRMLPPLSLQSLMTFPIHPMSTTLSCPLLTTRRIPPAQATFLSNKSLTPSQVTPGKTKHGHWSGSSPPTPVGIPYRSCPPRHVTSAVSSTIQLPTLSLLVSLGIAHNLNNYTVPPPRPFCVPWLAILDAFPSSSRRTFTDSWRWNRDRFRVNYLFDYTCTDEDAGV